MHELKDKSKLTAIKYNIHEYSSYSSIYEPRNIMKNDPLDPSSRWSTTTNDHRQFIILNYEPAIISTITFGKYSKIHVCNIKEMKISVSYDNISYQEVFYGGLKNDTKNETFNLQFYKDGEYIISQYMKIEPLAAWGMNFNYSIWFIELNGKKEKRQRKEESDRKKKLVEALSVIKSCGFVCELQQIINKLDFVNQDEDILKIKEALENFEYEKCIRIIKKIDESKFHNFIKRSEFLGSWEKIHVNGIWPCGRGGHQMVSMKDNIYLYGGWDGSEELGDMWLYKDDKWSCIHEDNSKNYKNGEKDPQTNYLCRASLTSPNYIIKSSECEEVHQGDESAYEQLERNSIHNNNYNTPPNINEIQSCQLENPQKINPGKRSCHKMCTDGKRIFLIGKYVPTVSRDSEYLTCEIWVYDTEWKIYESNGKDMAPNMYDHFLTYANNRVYMFGGKTTNMDETFGGLYEIDVRSVIDSDEPEFIYEEQYKDEIDVQRKTKYDFERDLYEEAENQSGITHETSEEAQKCYGNRIFNKKIRLPRRWYKIRDEHSHLYNTPALKSRLGHSVIYINKIGSFYDESMAIVGGQRGKEYFKSITFYSVKYNTVYESVPFPNLSDGRIIQRSVLFGTDIIVLFTFGKDKESRLDYFKLYTYSLIYRTWKPIIIEGQSPLPRTAHQFINHKNEFYLFGGNVGDKRQNDLWKLKLRRKTPNDIRNLMLMKLQKHIFLNYLDNNKREEAIWYLQNKAREYVVDKDTENIFNDMCHELFERKTNRISIEDICQYIGDGNVFEF